MNPNRICDGGLASVFFELLIKSGYAAEIVDLPPHESCHIVDHFHLYPAAIGGTEYLSPTIPCDREYVDMIEYQVNGRRVRIGASEKAKTIYLTEPAGNLWGKT